MSNKRAMNHTCTSDKCIVCLNQRATIERQNKQIEEIEQREKERKQEALAIMVTNIRPINEIMEDICSCEDPEMEKILFAEKRKALALKNRV